MSCEIEGLPLVSVIMPVRNEALNIEASAGAVLSQSYPRERLEIIISDGGSTDGTREKVQAMMELYPNLRLVDNPGRIVPTGMNEALRQARGEVIIRVDGHCQIPPDYVRRCVEALRQTAADCAGGGLVTKAATWEGRAIALAQSAAFGVGGAAFRTKPASPGYVDTLAFGAYRRQVFERIGGFDEELVRNQDDELNFRLIQSGGRIWLDPTIRVIYHCRSSLRMLWRQYFEYGLYKVRVMQKRGGVASWRHLVPALFVLALLSSLLAVPLAGNLLWLLSVAGPYVLLNALASLWAARNDPGTLPLLPAAFAILHLAYGLGFLYGLWRWRRGFAAMRLARSRSAG